MTPPPDEPIRILHFFDKLSTKGASFHGVLRLFSLQMPAHHHDRFRIGLTCLKPPDPTGEELKRQFAPYGIDVRNLMKSGTDFPSLWFGFRKNIRAMKPHILHLHGYAAQNIGRWFGKRMGIPTLCHEHAVQLSIPLYQLLADRLLAPFTDYGVAVSEHSKSFLVRERGFSPDRVFVVPNGLDPNQLPDLSNGEVARERKELGIPEGGRLVGIVGRLDPIKGHDFFLRAARKILERHPNTYFPVVGDGNLMPELKKMVMDLGIGRRVIFTGFRSRINPVLSALDVMVMPSLNEGFGMSLIEAMYKRLPVVVSHVGGMREIVVDGVNGLFVPPRDPEAIADRVDRLFRNPQLAEELAKNARVTAEKYTIQNTVRITEEIYETVYKNRFGAGIKSITF
jgi:glycosyltransferase involved in cell wall biosynthesis